MNVITGPVVYGLGIALAAAVAFSGLQTVRLAREQAAHAQTKQQHATVLREIADKTAEAARLAGIARAAYDAQALEDLHQHSKDIEDAFKRGEAAAGSINAGAVRVRTVWRDRECPQAVPGQGAEPDDGTADVTPGRADAIGRVLGHAGTWDAAYRLAYERLTAAQGLLNACYEEPALSNP
jgi:hypothetical protein